MNKERHCIGNYRYGEFKNICKGAKEECCECHEKCKEIYDERNVENGSDKS